MTTSGHIIGSLVVGAALGIASAYAIFQYKLGGSVDDEEPAPRINTSFDLKNDKVVHAFSVNEEIPSAAKKVYCRCWKSEKFPYCDGSHNKHNKETGDNVGPLIISN